MATAISFPGTPVSTLRNQFFVPISVSSTGDTVLVAGIAGRRIRVVSYNFFVAAGVVVTFKSSVAGAITGPKSVASNGGISTGEHPGGLFQTAVGEDLVINLSSNVSVGGELTYILMP